MARIPEHILDDLSSRFIVNIPKHERSEITRVMFQVELAHWFYLDLHCADKSNGLPSKGFKPFCQDLFAHIPFLKPFLDKLDAVLDEFKAYKQKVPTYGAIILDPTLDWMLLVQGYWCKTSWGFPKGKVNEGEDAMHCAIREVQEETGFDCRPYIRSDQFIEKWIHGTSVRLYIIPGISKEVKFEPQVRCEIKDITWHLISSVPETRQEQYANRYFMVMPFISELKNFIQQKRAENERPKKKPKRDQRQNPTTPTPTAILKRETTAVDRMQTPDAISTRRRTSRNKQSVTPIDTSVFSDAGTLPGTETPATSRTVTVFKPIDLTSFVRQSQRKSKRAAHTPIRNDTGHYSFGCKLWADFELKVDWPSIWVDVANEMENSRPEQSPITSFSKRTIQ